MAAKPPSRARGVPAGGRGKRTPEGGRDATARPVVKWVGGKSRLLGKLRAHVPEGPFGTYVEAFAGGAALFFSMADAKPRAFTRAVLADKNEELVTLYRVLQSDVTALVSRLAEVQAEYHAMDEDARRTRYYEVRDLDPGTLPDVERAARLLFLNRTCFNGLWRVNARGVFNVPFGRYAHPRILDEDTLRSAHAALARTTIRHADFEEVTRGLGPRDFVYFDPPYVPVSKTANFTAYAEGKFGKAEQDRLVEVLVDLRERGVRAMLSNAEESRALYEKARLFVHDVTAPRAINSDPSKRGDVRELIVTTYDERGKVGMCKPVRRKVAS